MKDFIDKSIEEFNEEFMVRVSGDKASCLRNEDDVFVTKPMILKDFFRQKLQEAIDETKQSAIEALEEYFKGLIVIGNPQATKKNIIKLIKEL